MSAGRFDLNLEQGADFELGLVWRANGVLVDLTGATAKLQVKADYDSAALFSLTEGVGLTLGGTAGTITIAITDTQVGLLSLLQPSVYDLQVTISSKITRLLQGVVNVSRAVST